MLAIGATAPVKVIPAVVPIIQVQTVEADEIVVPPVPPPLTDAEVLASTSAALGLSSAKTKKVIDIVHCESGGRQFNPDGSVNIGPTGDVGLFQINKVHWQDAASRHLDIFTSATDNAIYGISMYKKEGTAPWLASKPCWSQSPAHW